jgi:hypothetical protein
MKSEKSNFFSIVGPSIFSVVVVVVLIAVGYFIVSRFWL